MDIEKDADSWKKEGNTFVSQKKYEKAIECYTNAIKINPKDHSFYSNRAICHYNLSDYLACINDCDLCLNIMPNFTKALRRKGLAYIQLLKFN
jgi:tetratricopeptide (TPR) repeat protein